MVFNPEDEDYTFLLSAGNHLQDYNVSQPRRPQLTKEIFSFSISSQILKQNLKHFYSEVNPFSD
jgi:hypothetical protein